MVINARIGVLDSEEALCNVSYWDHGKFIPNTFEISLGSNMVYLDNENRIRISKNVPIKCFYNESNPLIMNICELFGKEFINEAVSMILSGSKFIETDKNFSYKIDPDLVFNSSRSVKFPKRNVEVSLSIYRFECSIWIPSANLFEDKSEYVAMDDSNMYPIWKDLKNKNNEQLQFTF